MDSQEEVLVDVKLAEVCPICLEGENLFLLKCSHCMHLECAKGMTDALCPLCRACLKEDLPEEILESIESRKRDYRANLEAEDMERFEQHFSDPCSFITMFVNPRPHIEVKAALVYLRNQGIPLSCLPERILIKNPVGHPRPRCGVIFQVLVGQAISKMKSMIEPYDSDSDTDEESDSDSESVEDRLIAMVESIPVDPETYGPVHLH